MFDFQAQQREYLLNICMENGLLDVMANCIGTLADGGMNLYPVFPFAIFLRPTGAAKLGAGGAPLHKICRRRINIHKGPLKLLPRTVHSNTFFPGAGVVLRNFYILEMKKM